DLIHASAPLGSQSASSTPSGVQAVTSPTGQTTKADQTSVAGPSISSVNALSTDNPASLGILFLPIIIGVLIGAVFYGLFIRRADAE
ncbi:MAG: hypothetical protein OK436_07715, partial [Thaumarchaeota archaeon]|nr:hypothetical protein [Nitrososphaerota archaeon]